MPFQIPDSWMWVKLGEIIALISGQDLTTNEYNSTQNGIPYITGASNFDNGEVMINRWTEVPKSIAYKGDLLITCKGTVGLMAFLKVDQAHIARQIMAIRSYNINLEYIRIFLESNLKTLQSQAKSMIPGIARDDILTANIPLPPAKEQKRIVNKVDEFMVLINYLTQIINQTA
jgi:type I restriction enzyme S subunit